MPFRTKHTISHCKVSISGTLQDTRTKTAGYHNFSLGSRGPWLFRASYGDGRASAKPSHSLFCQHKAFAIASRSCPSLTPNLPRSSLPLSPSASSRNAQEKKLHMRANQRDRWPTSTWGRTLPTLPARMWSWPMIPRWPTPRR